VGDSGSDPVERDGEVGGWGTVASILVRAGFGIRFQRGRGGHRATKILYVSRKNEPRTALWKQGGGRTEIAAESGGKGVKEKNHSAWACWGLNLRLQWPRPSTPGQGGGQVAATEKT